MLISVKAANHIENYRLQLTFNTGETGEVDLQDLVFKYQAALSLRDINQFKKFFLDEWSTVSWDCGFDISPETLYERATGKRLEWLYDKAEHSTEIHQDELIEM